MNKIEALLRSFIRPTWKFNIGEVVYYEGIKCVVTSAGPSKIQNNQWRIELRPIQQSSLIAASVGDCQYAYNKLYLRIG